MGNGKRTSIVVLLVLLVLTGSGMAGVAMLACGQDSKEVPAGAQGDGPVGVEVFSLAEAESGIGTAIPFPTYLPSDFQLHRIFVYPGSTVQFYFSDQAITDPPASFYLSRNRWQQEFERPGGARLVLDAIRGQEVPGPVFWENVAPDSLGLPGEVVDLGTAAGVLTDPSKVPPPQQAEYLLPYLGEADGEYQIDDVWYLTWWHSEFRFEMKAPKDMEKDELIKIASSVPVVEPHQENPCA